MTVSTEDVVHRYRPGTAMAAEAIPFQFLDADAVVVTVFGVGAASARLVPGAHYAIGGDGMTRAGTVTALVPRIDGEIWQVARVSEQLQKTSIPPHEPLPAVQAERQLDRLTMVDQEQGAAIALHDTRLRIVEAGIRSFVLDPGVNPVGLVVFDPGVDPVITYVLDPGEF